MIYLTAADDVACRRVLDAAVAARQRDGEPPKLNRDQLAAIALTICEEYAQQDLRMTVRTLYYQFVSRGVLPSGDKHYKRVVSTLAKARLLGAFPMHYLIDSGRNVGLTDNDTDDTSVEGAERTVAGWVRNARYAINRARWYGQESWVSVWIEKEALAEVFRGVCEDLGVGLFPCKGYPSVTALHEWGKAAQSACDLYDDAKADRAVILYCGDHDPDGLQIPDSCLKNIHTMQRESVLGDFDIDLYRIALTTDQIDLYDPPPFPAKQTSARFKNYVATTGLTDAWELDALSPTVLRDLIEDHVGRYFDDDVYDENREFVEQQRDELERVLRVPGWIDSVFNR